MRGCVGACVSGWVGGWVGGRGPEEGYLFFLKPPAGLERANLDRAAIVDALEGFKAVWPGVAGTWYAPCGHHASPT